jgi:hypothetical protein
MLTSGTAGNQMRIVVSYQMHYMEFVFERFLSLECSCWRLFSLKTIACTSVRPMPSSFDLTNSIPLPTNSGGIPGVFAILYASLPLDDILK